MQPDTSDDRKIIQNILSGDRDAYAGLVRKYQDRILSLCISMLTDAKEAEDAAQEAFTKAFYALPRFKGNSSFYTWLYRIASNHCLDIARKKGRHRAHSWEELLEEKGDEIEALVSHADDSAREDDAELVREVLSRLSPDYRLILTLREIEGFSYEEIAAALDCSLDAVKGRLKRAREDFREKLRHLKDSENV